MTLKGSNEITITSKITTAISMILILAKVRQLCLLAKLRWFPFIFIRPIVLFRSTAILRHFFRKGVSTVQIHVWINEIIVYWLVVIPQAKEINATVASWCLTTSDSKTIHSQHGRCRPTTDTLWAPHGTQYSAHLRRIGIVTGEQQVH